MWGEVGNLGSRESWRFEIPEDKRKQLSKLVEIWVSEQKPILQVMEELGEYAKIQGLTKEKLDVLLKDE